MAADFAAPKCRNLPLLTLAVARMDLYNRLEFVDPIALWLTANHAQHDLVFQITPKPASAVPFAPLCGPRVGTVRGLWSQWKLCTFVGARGRRRANGGLRRPERRRGWTQCHPSFGCRPGRTKNTPQDDDGTCGSQGCSHSRASYGAATPCNLKSNSMSMRRETSSRETRLTSSKSLGASKPEFERRARET